jgi:hypothetical protein
MGNLLPVSLRLELRASFRFKFRSFSSETLTPVPGSTG